MSLHDGIIRLFLRNLEQVGHAEDQHVGKAICGQNPQGICPDRGVRGQLDHVRQHGVGRFEVTGRRQLRDGSWESRDELGPGDEALTLERQGKRLAALAASRLEALDDGLCGGERISCGQRKKEWQRQPDAPNHPEPRKLQSRIRHPGLGTRSLVD